MVISVQGGKPDNSSHFWEQLLFFCRMWPHVRKRGVCGGSLAGILGSNLARVIDACLVSAVCCQIEVSAMG